jgi:hypothetical protein
MREYFQYKKKKFLENSNSFILVSFFSDPQKNFVALRNLLFSKNLKIKVLKSKSIYPLINKYIISKHTTFINSVSKCPLFVIENIYPKDSIISNFFNISEIEFKNRKMQILGGFENGKIICNAKMLFSLKPKEFFLDLFFFNLKKLKINLMSFFYINAVFLIKLFFIYCEKLKIK